MPVQISAQVNGSSAAANGGIPNGPAAAAVLAAGIGCAVTGVAVVLAVISTGFKDAMNWWAPAGPLVGKSTVGVLAWIVSWTILHLRWRRREISFGVVWAAALLLIAVGFAFTFPPIFEAFAHHP